MNYMCKISSLEAFNYYSTRKYIFFNVNKNLYYLLFYRYNLDDKQQRLIIYRVGIYLLLHSYKYRVSQSSVEAERADYL